MAPRATVPHDVGRPTGRGADGVRCSGAQGGWPCAHEFLLSACSFSAGCSAARARGEWARRSRPACRRPLARGGPTATARLDDPAAPAASALLDDPAAPADVNADRPDADASPGPESAADANHTGRPDADPPEVDRGSAGFVAVGAARRGLPDRGGRVRLRRQRRGIGGRAVQPRSVAPTLADRRSARANGSRSPVARARDGAHA